MRVGLDATPLLGERTGVGRYVSRLVPALAALPQPPQLRLTAFTWRGAADVPALGGAVVTSRRAPARLLQAAWSRADLPQVEWLSGRVDVFHGTNFVAPPSRRAAPVVTVHDLAFLRHADTVSPQSLRYRLLVPRALARGALVLTPSRAVADEVREAYGLSADRVHPTPLGVDERWLSVSRPTPQQLQTLGLPERYLLFVGALEPRKDLPSLLRAHAALRAADPQTPPLVLAGPAGWADGPAPQDGVLAAGYLRDDALVPLVAGAQCLALPSRYEGFGLPVLEALACGTPVVCTDVPALSEVGGDVVRRVPVGDTDALAEALAVTLAEGPDGPARTRRREHAARWSWSRCAKQTLAAYEAAAD